MYVVLFDNADKFFLLLNLVGKSWEVEWKMLMFGTMEACGLCQVLFVQCKRMSGTICTV